MAPGILLYGPLFPNMFAEGGILVMPPSCFSKLSCSLLAQMQQFNALHIFVLVICIQNTLHLPGVNVQ